MPVRLLISETAAHKLRYAAQELPNLEVSGFGKVRVNPNGSEVELIDIVIPPQVVGSAHVDISPEVRDAFFTEVKRNGCGGAQCERRSPETNGRDKGWEKIPAGTRNKPVCTAGVWCEEGDATAIWRDPEEGDTLCASCYDNWIHMHDEKCGEGDLREWRVWWHKHPGNGKPSPSGTDRTTLEELAGPTGFRFGWMIGVIISADASAAYCWMEYAGEPFHMELTDIPVAYAYGERPKLRDMVRKQMEKVKIAARPYYSTTPSSPPTNQSYNGFDPKREQRWDSEKKQWVDKYPQLPSGSHVTTPDLSKGVKEIRPSKTYPGSVEIEREDGTIIVTKDTGQLRDEGGRRYIPVQRPSKAPGSRAPKKIRARAMALVQTEGLKWVGQGTATELQDREGNTYIGLDFEGKLLREGEERYLYYTFDHKLKAVVASSAFRRTLEQEMEQIDREITAIMGDDHIGYDCEGTPLRKGEEQHLCYDTEGQPLMSDLAPVPTVHPDPSKTPEGVAEEIREGYNLPFDLDPEDAYAYAALMYGI